MSTAELKMGSESENISSKQKKAGPLGLGDPEDRTLRKVETEVMIPKLVRERLKKEHCAEFKDAFDECCIKNNLMMFVHCREENRRFQDCMNRWFFQKEFIDECTEIYLAKRAEFRRTGIKERQKRFEK